MSRRPTALAPALAALLLAAPAHAQSPGVVPSADFFVSSAKKRAHYGKARELVAGRRRSYTGFLRFTLSAPVPAGGRVILRLFPVVANSTGLTVKRATGGRWNEKAAAYLAAPRIAGAGIASGPLTRDQPVDIDVTSLVSGTTASFGLITTSQSPVVVGSREAGPRAPQLVVGA